jgi:hypothetical protein
MFLQREPPKTEYTLLIFAKNVGKIYAQYVNAVIQIPRELAYIHEYLEEMNLPEKKLMKEIRTRFHKGNTVRDVVEFGIGTANKYGPSRFDPILPGLLHKWEIRITDKFEQIEKDGLEVEWWVYADNAPESNGRAPVKAMRVVDERDS